MKYQIIYNGEIIVTTYDEHMAKHMLKEYRIAFKCDDIYIRVVY